VELSVAVRQALVVLGLADGARVIADLDDDAVAWGDVRALKQVIVNLVGNALKYGGDGPVRVETVAGAEGGPCRLTVSDTGPGIPASELPRVTEPFYTVDKDSWVANDRGGTGIGLALVKRLVEEMDGQLTIDSVEGAGTTVEVQLPQVSLTA
jgi:signal transduction histidine kinase